MDGTTADVPRTSTADGMKEHGGSWRPLGDLRDRRSVARRLAATMVGKTIDEIVAFACGSTQDDLDALATNAGARSMMAEMLGAD